MNRHRTTNARWVVVACAAALLVGAPCPARAASPEDCRVCNVERLECRATDDARAPKTSHERQDHETQDPDGP